MKNKRKEKLLEELKKYVSHPMTEGDLIYFCHLDENEYSEYLNILNELVIEKIVSPMMYDEKSKRCFNLKESCTEKSIIGWKLYENVKPLTEQEIKDLLEI